MIERRWLPCGWENGGEVCIEGRFITYETGLITDPSGDWVSLDGLHVNIYHISSWSVGK